MTVGPQHAGKALPPVLGEAKVGGAAPFYFNMTGHPNQPPASTLPPPKKAENKACVLKPATSTSKGELIYKSPPIDRAPVSLSLIHI
eukprot:7753409-Prorocentrum_lima.AAC.1